MLHEQGSCLCHVCKDLRRPVGTCQNQLRSSRVYERVQRQKTVECSELCSLTGVGCIYNSVTINPGQSTL